MAVNISNLDNITSATNRITSVPWTLNVDEFVVHVPVGSLHIGGDFPIGVVTLNGSPVARVVDVFDRVEKVLVSSTVSSAIDGSFNFPNLSDRAYDVIIRGETGERDIIVPNVSPV